MSVHPVRVSMEIARMAWTNTPVIVKMDTLEPTVRQVSHLFQLIPRGCQTYEAYHNPFSSTPFANAALKSSTISDSK